MSSFLEFLNDSKLKVSSASKIVIGNMAMDLDSTISSLVYSYFKSRSGDLFHPIINIPHQELKYRTDVCYILKKYKIDPKVLIYEPEMRNYLVTNKSKIEVTLIDHNVATYPFLDHNVVEIIDHHVDEKLFQDTCLKRNIELVGSCCTLIALEIMHFDSKFFEKEKLCAELLLTVIIADTVNMNPRINKATESDVKVIHEFCKLLKIGENDRTKILEDVKTEYFNVSELNDSEVLDADYKHFGNEFGICSCRRRVVDEEELENYRIKKNVKVLFVMIQVLNERKEFCRELIIFQKEEGKFKMDNIIGLMNDKDLALDVLERKSNRYVLMTQKNISFSRKRISPFLKKFF